MAEESSRAGASRITHLYLENWKNFTQVDVDLQRRVFLVGPNASGKSNLLDALRFLRDVVSVGGGLAQAVRRRGSLSAVRSLAARRYSDVVFSIGLGSNGNAGNWRYELAINQDNQQRPVVRREAVYRGNEPVLTRPDSDDESDRERLTQTHLEQVNVNRRFREVADFFKSIQYLHIVPQLVREPDRSVGRTNDPFGGDFLEQIALTSQRTQRARLRRIARALQVAVPQLQELELWKDARGTPHLRGRYEHWRPKGAWQHEDQLSDGTLRLMGLLWAVMSGRGPLLLEEPELSLHAGVVRFLPALFSRMQSRTGRQILVSSHSSELFQDENIGLDEVLVLFPGKEGTTVQAANARDDIKVLLEGGSSLAEILMPMTRPKEASQLGLFDAS